MTEYNSALWHELVTTGKKLETRTTHNLPRPFVNTILGTLEYFGASQRQLKSAYFDLIIAKYKIYDWLGMCLTGRLDTEKTDRLYTCIEKMTELYIKQEHVGGWAWWLRGHDMDVSTIFKCQDCIQSYDEWIKECKENGTNPNDYE